ncbi:MAG: CTP synthase, partial [Gemmatimonadetes bacterium]|nr:CTP synthase [Gemmatimonadota bacterium]
PHITDEIKRAIRRLSVDHDVVITEIGGTVGDIESLPFLEAIRQFRQDVGRENVLFIHLTLVPYIAAAGELKTKPTQHSVRELMEIGIQPDILICRSEHPVDADIRRKIALFTNVEPDAVIEARDVESIYQVPMELRKQRLDDVVVRRLGLDLPPPDLGPWTDMVETSMHPGRGKVRIAVVGKYTALVDSYKSVQQALLHGGIANDVAVEIDWLNSESFDEDSAASRLAAYDGLLIPGGFGPRGVEGMVAAIRHARESGLPFFGICLGLQCAVIEFARHVCRLGEAHSMEFSEDTGHPVICLMDSQQNVTRKGGTMRLGAYRAALEPGSLAARIYGQSSISERHRHRFEVNNEYRALLEEHGLKVSAVWPDGGLVEIVELPDHPWFLAGQFHPELKSRPMRPHPLFASFIAAAVRRRDGVVPGRRSADEGGAAPVEIGRTADAPAV